MSYARSSKDKLNDAAAFLAEYFFTAGSDYDQQVETVHQWTNSEDITPFEVGENQETLLLICAQYAIRDIFGALTRMGLDLKAQDKDGNGVFHYACSLRGAFLGQGPDYLSCFDWLIDNGMDINTQNNKGQTPLFRIWESLMPGEVDELAEPSEGESVAQNEFTQILEYFTAKGAHVWHKDHNGQTFLDVAPKDNLNWCFFEKALMPFVAQQQHEILTGVAAKVSEKRLADGQGEALDTPKSKF